MKRLNRMWLPVAAAMCGLALGAGRVSAAEIAVETFETYTAGNDLNGGADGTGWSGNWSGGAGEVTAESGVVPDRGLSMQVTDNASTDPLITRSFPAQTGTLYLGFLLRKSAAFDVQDMLQVYLDNGGGYSNGVSTGFRNGNNKIFARVSGATTEGLVGIADTTYQIVLKVSKSAVPGNYTTVDIFVSQRVEGTPTVSHTSNANTDTLSRFAIRTFDGGGSAGVQQAFIDELRIATTYAEALAATAVPANSTVVSATIVEDAYIQSSSPATPYNNGGDSVGVYVRNHSGPTRAGFVQFTLPQLGAGQSVTAAALSGVGSTTIGPNDAPVTVGLSVNPDLTTLTWNDAVSANIITGRDGADYHVLWGTAATTFAETFAGQVIQRGETSLTDATPADDLLKFINDNISTAGPVTVTFGIGGPAGNSDYTYSWYNREATDGLYPAVWAPTLELTILLPVRGTVITVH